jgi:hypothetical protein
MLYDSTKVAEATAAFYCAAAIKTLESIHPKGMGILPIGADGLSSQRIALPDEDGLDYHQNLSSAVAEYPYVIQILEGHCSCHLANLGLSDANLRIPSYPQMSSHASKYSHFPA